MHTLSDVNGASLVRKKNVRVPRQATWGFAICYAEMENRRLYGFQRCKIALVTQKVFVKNLQGQKLAEEYEVTSIMDL